ncbi:MAG: DUF3526 domain-containing protein [Methylotenera sp.]|nr:DUF3526 domain-containing protein [Methylotenera sp.]
MIEMIKYEYLLVLRQRFVIYACAITMLITWLSLMNGWQSIENIHNEIYQAQHQEQIRLKEQAKFYAQHGGAGEVGYYVFHLIYDTPSEFSFIAIGNRLVTPHIQRIRLLGLQGQLYDGESHNPEYVSMGALDFSFVIIFLSPLLSIALMHDLKAAEEQTKRLGLIRSLSNSMFTLWLKRSLVRWSIIFLSFAIPLGLFSALKMLDANTSFYILNIVMAYTLLWAFISTVVTLKLKQASATKSAMLLLFIWIIVTIIAPNIAQTIIHKHLPLLEGSEIAIQHRKKVHSAWDKPKETTMQEFYKIYPQWKSSPAITGRFHWKWYYAFQHLADVSVQLHVAKREEVLIKRNLLVERLSIFLPNVWVQSKLESISQSNVTHLLEHRRKIVTYHEQLRNYFYPYLFNEQPFSQQVFKAIPHFRTN